eukprot:131306-Amphidinium_carterae.1
MLPQLPSTLTSATAELPCECLSESLSAMVRIYVPRENTIAVSTPCNCHEVQVGEILSLKDATIYAFRNGDWSWNAWPHDDVLVHDVLHLLGTPKCSPNLLPNRCVHRALELTSSYMPFDIFQFVRESSA